MLLREYVDNAKTVRRKCRGMVARLAYAPASRALQRWLLVTQESGLDRLREFAGAVPLLERLKAEQLERFCDSVQTVWFSDGDVVVEEGRAATACTL